MNLLLRGVVYNLMCCFTQPVTAVKNTRIYASAENDERQFIAYQMHLDTKHDVVMVLPLPVKPGADEHAVKFISLKDYPDFFADLEKGFPAPPPPAFIMSGSNHSESDSAPLEVVQVGNFEASFVPTVKDFSRLDARFRLPDDIWQKLGGYPTYGFAVFKLKQGTQDVHPMAFSFPRRDTQSLFFPTVHIHDGKVHETADFDHILYCQPREGEPLKFDEQHAWEESQGQPRGFMKMKLVAGLIQPDEHCYKTIMRGDLPNRDTLVALDM